MNLPLKTTLFTFFLCVLGSLAFVFRVPKFTSAPHPLSSYSEALEAFALLEKKETQLPLSPEGHSRLLTHGIKTERVFVLLHGLSSCPEEVVPLGNILFQSGANVLIVRARYAGFSNLLNKEQGEQSGEDLLEQAALSLDIAAGLGDKISLVTISASAVAGAWMAEHRSGISQILIIAPFFGLHGWPVPFMNALAFVFSKIPNFFIWKPPLPHAPPYAYPRYGTHCLGKTLLFACAVRCFQGSLQVDHLDVLLSPSDGVVNNNLTKKIIAGWALTNPGKINLYEFPKAWHIPHDCLDPYQFNSKIEKTYPLVLKILNVPNTWPEVQ